MFKGIMKELFYNFDSFNWDFSVFAEPHELTLQSRCVCLDSDDEDIIEDEFYRKIIFEGEEYVEFLSIQDISQVFNNLKAQGVTPDDDLKLRAILYYYETDRFLEVNA